MKRFIKVEGVVLVALLVAFAAAGFLFSRHVTANREALVVREWTRSGQAHAVQALDLQAMDAAVDSASHPTQSGEAKGGLLSSELRVAAIGSAYPIPYDAEVCPFTGVLQPAENQLDRDGDGMTDDWERKYGLDARNGADARSDLDEDGFSNLEEFVAETDPSDIAAHPPYIVKMRFVSKKNILFPLVFMGAVELPDGRVVFQINTPSNGKTHFRTIGGKVEGILLKRLIPRDRPRKARLVVERDGVEIELPRGEKVPDPKSQGELINILDRQTRIATMGALLSLRNDDYTVLEVSPDKITVRYHKTDEVFEVVGFADGERELLFGGFEK